MNNGPDQLPSLQQLLRQLQKVPYLASKNVYRVSDYFLKLPEDQVAQFCETLLATCRNIMRCVQCCAWQERTGQCQFCSSPTRDHKIICVVEQWQDVLVLERSGAYKGLYHVLGGVLSPLEGIGFEQLSIDLLIKRATSIDELIFALGQTPEGETTAAYIADKLKKFPLKITCLAQGMPVGSSLEFMDRLTVYKALAQRREF